MESGSCYDDDEEEEYSYFYYFFPRILSPPLHFTAMRFCCPVLLMAEKRITEAGKSLRDCGIIPPPLDRWEG